ncbi:MAG: hypothetical protein Q4G19_03465 [Clostridia bacterium]|nr:hypothetical protein [Clostridia bacterium]
MKKAAGEKAQNPEKNAEKSVDAYYDLKRDAVEDLVTADSGNSPRVSEAELRKYRSGSKKRMPEVLKILFIKFWFAGAICFFFLWGLGMYVSALLDLLVITGLALGFVTDLLTNNVLRFIAKRPGGNDKWMMWPKKGFVSLPLNILHSCTILFLVYTVYNALNLILIRMSGAAQDAVPLGVEPLLFGILYMACDMLLIGAKRMAAGILRDAGKKTSAHS